MTGEVLSHGDDDRRGSGRLLGYAAVAVLLLAVGLAVVRSRDPAPDARPTPSPSAAAPASPTPEPPFDVAVSLPLPEEVKPVLLPGGEPVFLVPVRGGTPRAFPAYAGPDHEQVLVGYCWATQTFHDTTGTRVWNDLGDPLAGHDGLPGLAVRLNADGTRVEVGADRTPNRAEWLGETHPPSCPEPLDWPDLPDRAGDVHGTIEGWRVVRGRYVVSTESRSFCPPRAECRSRGWEDWGHGLPFEDIAGSYAWEGDFLVHADPDTGRLHAIRLRGARLVERTGVGANVLSFIAEDYALDGSSLRFTVRGPETETFTVGPDAAVFVGHGVTGLGLPRGTPEALYMFLTSRSRLYWRVAVVLDKDGDVIRAVVEP